MGQTEARSYSGLSSRNRGFEVLVKAGRPLLAEDCPQPRFFERPLIRVMGEWLDF